MKTCTTHHHACDCREQKVAVLIKAALDAAAELDGLKAAWAAAYPNDESVSEEAERLDAVVSRTYDAAEQLGIDVATGKEAANSPESDLEEATRRA